LIRRFAAGELSTDQFENAYESNAGDDRVLFEVGLGLWRFYDDQSEHRLEGRHALSPNGNAMFNRCALFLETQDQYRWPLSPALPERISRFLKRLRRRAPAPLHDPTEEACEPEVWPFYRSVDYSTAKQARALDE
jgi:hypothetical protein